MALAESAPLSSTLSSDEDLSAPEGWKKKVVPKKGGTPKKKDVVYIAPDGEEIKTKRQLDKWLKNNPGKLSASDFDWSTGETPRRSARLSSKGRLSSDNLDEEEPALKKSKSDQDDDYVIVSPRKVSKRKSGPPDVTGAEENVDVVEKVDLPQETVVDGISVDADTKSSAEKVENALENNLEEAAAEGEIKEQAATEAIPANSTETIVVEEQALRADDPVVVTEAAVPEVTPVVTVEETILAGTDGLPATEGPVKTPEVDIAIKNVEGTKSADDAPNATIEIQESHAVVDEPTILSGVVT